MQPIRYGTSQIAGSDTASDLFGYLDGLALGLDEAVLRTVVAEVTGGNTSVTRRLLWDLQNQPGLRKRR
ncbi:hypothetical protein [Streptomyces sp. NPDC002328]|uniref:hypothetical protein n=1 Tax=Streptomyces sp. NPDC002328 TaxID=3364642 RepID=UPI0036C7AD52